MTDIKELLFEICGDERVYNEDYDLIENDILDSLAIIDLFSALEDEGMEIQLTQIDRSKLRTSRSIQDLLDEYESK